MLLCRLASTFDESDDLQRLGDVQWWSVGCRHRYDPLEQLAEAALIGSKAPANADAESFEKEPADCHPAIAPLVR